MSREKIRINDREWVTTGSLNEGMKGRTKLEKEAEADASSEKQSPAERTFPIGFQNKEL